MSNKSELLQKIKRLAEKGVDGEMEAAEFMLKKLMKKYGITAEELEEELVSKYEFRYSSKPFERQLLAQIMFMVTGCKEIFAPGKSKKHVLFMNCTKSQKIEIESTFDFYKAHLEKGLKKYYSAFIQCELLFPEEIIQEGPRLDLEKIDPEESKLMSAMKPHEFNNVLKITMDE